MAQTITSQVLELQNSSVDALRQRWRELFGIEPCVNSRRALEDRLAYRIQELALGGLKPSTRKRLEALGDSLDGGDRKVRRVRADVIPVPGTRLVREWKGVEHTVTVTQSGFDYQGQPFQSLSPIAKRITGTSWSGFVFFGLKSPASHIAAGPGGAGSRMIVSVPLSRIKPEARPAAPLAATPERLLTVRVPFRVRPRGGRVKIVAPDGQVGQHPAPPRPDNAMVKAIARGFRWRKLIETGVYASVADVARAEKISDSYVSRHLRLTLLSPRIIEAVLDGRQGADVTLPRLLSPFPVIWAEQFPADH